MFAFTNHVSTSGFAIGQKTDSRPSLVFYNRQKSAKSGRLLNKPLHLNYRQQETKK
jgi:hypothetical protein